MLVDTSFVIDLLRGDEEAQAMLDRLEAEDVPLRLAPGVVFELYHGAETADQEDAIDRLVEEIPRAPLTAHAEREAGRIDRTLLEAGEPVGSVDALVAGTAHAEDVRLLTADAHFERMDQVRTVSHRDA